VKLISKKWEIKLPRERRDSLTFMYSVKQEVDVPSIDRMRWVIYHDIVESNYNRRSYVTKKS